MLAEAINKLPCDLRDIVLLSYFANMPDIEKVEPMTHALDDFSFILREDVAKESIPVENLLQNCDSVEDDFVSVPKVVG